MAPQATDSASSSSKFKVVFVGAGGVNFGSLEGPWNHSARLERILGKNLEVTALVSPAGREKVLALKRSSPAASSYANTKEYDDVSAFHADLASAPDSNSIKPDLVLVGVPPAYHGNTARGTDIEIQLSNLITNNFVLVCGEADVELPGAGREAGRQVLGGEATPGVRGILHALPEAGADHEGHHQPQQFDGDSYGGPPAATPPSPRRSGG